MGKEGLGEVRLDQVRVDQVCVDQVCVDQVCVDQVCVEQVCVDQVRVDQVCVDQVRVDQVRVDQVRVDNADRRTVDSVHQDAANDSETAVRKRTTVSLYVAAAAVAAAGCVSAAVLRDPTPLSLDIIAFLILATLTELREIRMPLVGIVTLSFVPVLALSLIHISEPT